MSAHHGDGCFSLSHKGLDVSYCEIRVVGQRGLLLRIAMTSAYLGFKGLQNALISRCETHSGLCDRLKHPCCGAPERPHLPRIVRQSLTILLAMGHGAGVLCWLLRSVFVLSRAQLPEAS
jgi:hypothetical protein